MASLRTLFLGVYASNSAIRVLFLPVFYILLLSPFLTLAGYYFGLGRTLSTYVPEDFSWFDLLPHVALSAVFLLLPTRLLSGSRNASTSNDGGKRRIQSLPYWIPGFRHFWSIVFGGESWLKSVRGSAIDNLIAYKAVGAKHNIILTDTPSEDSLMTQVYQNSKSLQVPRSSKWAILRNAFRMPGQSEDRYFEFEDPLNAAIQAEIYTATEKLTLATVNILSESLPDFITFNSSIVDQMQWERVSDVELTDGTSEAECNLFALINDFCCNAILPPLLGAHFTESYQLLASDLATFNQRYWALAIGLPRLSPIQGLPGAALAQKRLLKNLTNLFNDLTNPPVRRVLDDDESVSGEETDADIPTPIANMNEIFISHVFHPGVRAAITLQVIHDIFAEVVPIVFWTILHTYASPAGGENETTPVEKIKHQSRQWAQAIQPPSIHPSFPAPPEIVFDTASGTTIQPNTFPYLHSCITEARRLYRVSNTTYTITQPITLTSPSVQPGQLDKWELEAGSYLDLGLSQSLINSSPTVFPDPKSFRADRFTNLSPSSITDPTDKSEAYKYSLIAAIVTGIVQLWEIAPAPKKSFLEHMQEAREEAQIGAAALSGEQKAARSSQVRERKAKEKKDVKWVIPVAVDGASVKVPKLDVRVRIRRREGLPEKVMKARK